MSNTAAELMKKLAKDKQYIAKKEKEDKRIDKLKHLYEQDEQGLVKELNSYGLSIESVWDLVNSNNDYINVVPVLTKHLRKKHHPKILSGVARALAIEEISNNNELWDTLVELYKTTLPDREIDLPEDRGLQQSIAVALEALVDRSRIDDLQHLIQNCQNCDGIEWLIDKVNDFLE